MTITRETLELAALAAGHEIDKLMQTDSGGLCIVGSDDDWMPHADIADAARLAIRRAVTTMLRVDGHVLAFVPPGLHPVEVHHDGTEADTVRAYCEAITMCVAEIGRRMKEAK